MVKACLHHTTNVYDHRTAMYCATQVRQEVFPELELFGAYIRDEIDALGRQAEQNPPYLRYGEGESDPGCTQ